MNDSTDKQDAKHIASNAFMEGEILFRQIHPMHIDNGDVGSIAFRPQPKDENNLSVDRGSLTSASDAYERFVMRGFVSECCYGVSVAECMEVELTPKADPIEPKDEDIGNPYHAVIDFLGVNNSQQKKKSKSLRDSAVARGVLHPLVTSPVSPPCASSSPPDRADPPA